MRPLFFADRGDRLVFGSEIKALLTHPGIHRDVDFIALGQVFSSWAPGPPRSMFKGVSSLRPGQLVIESLYITVVLPVWRMRFPSRWDASRWSEADATECQRYLLFAKKAFDVPMADEDVVPVNVDSVDRLAACVRAKPTMVAT